MIFNFSVEYWDEIDLKLRTDRGYVQGNDFDSAYKKLTEYYDLDTEANSICITVPEDSDENGELLVVSSTVEK